MLLRGNRFLDSVKLQALVQTMADQLEMRQPHIFIERTEFVNADDAEIIAKYKGSVVAADVIADDQEALTYEGGSYEFTTNQIPNIKHGRRINQNMINRLMRLSRNLVLKGDETFFSQWETRTAEELVKGIRDRVNALICAMQIDATSYDRLGIKLSGVGWGMPSNLKVTPAVGWDDATNSTPITDLQVMITQTGPDNYGEIFNRVTLSSRAFRYLTASVEFQNRVRGELRFNFGTGQINVNDVGHMQQLLSNILNCTVEVYDGTYWERDSKTGAKVRRKVLDNNKVLLSNTQDDNNSDAMDFANGIVTESVVGTLVGEEGFDGEAFGPIAYWTHNPGLNPPSLIGWAVLRGFPRKHRETATAVLTVGSGSAWN